ncbi:hypothetical protein LQ757_05875 [Agromyces sp. SYSU K20354]|uniref:hypothetical protein n=1 Tax=Agromyces cavernae TaxID=2898659 RepID=UPI001E5B28F0|nr:hypothetical protein [Agromyces cavernae]MCD2441804.1 hypothetical protein [Agromyces cavernae]
MSRQSGGSRYRPDRLWRVGNRIGGAAITALGVIFMGAGIDNSVWPLVALGLVCTIASIWWWLRVPRARVEYDSAGVVTVVGLLWTRRIDRSAVRMVVTDADWPTILWTDKRGRRRWTILTPIATGNGWYGLLLLSTQSIDDRRGYLRRLERWATTTQSSPLG